VNHTNNSSASADHSVNTCNAICKDQAAKLQAVSELCDVTVIENNSTIGNVESINDSSDLQVQDEQLQSLEKDDSSIPGKYEYLVCIVTYDKRKPNKINLQVKVFETGSIQTVLQDISKVKIIEKLTVQYEDQKKYWIKLLKRTTDVIKFLACKGLAFRGDNQIFGSKHNGNYLGILELLSEYDTFLKEHISCHGNKGHGVTSYLSANICKEFIESMEKNVLKSIIEELKKSKYYSISVDSTPDITHTDQLTFTVRYVIDTGPVERFLTFIPIEGHGAEYLSTVIIDFLEKNDLNIKDCRGQSYDNASNMSGRYSGLQARIKQLNKYAEYISCAAHSLNLVGVKAAECVQPVVAWRILLVELGAGNLVLKALPATRWSAQADAITALCKGYTNIMKALNKISNDTTMSSEARHEAQSLLKKMLNLQTLFLTIYTSLSIY
ncbi:uncharacterized protein LOC111643308, partial [Copidosoma floridanum]|uniref:uncharacterized protein LOC111643308 n=1 Tax=Copidosoma floridanum TaxID=29053 RepID=UPI000C6F7D9B